MIRRATQSDPVLQAITYYLRTGWPEGLCAVYEPYFQQRDALTVVDGCLMLAGCIVIPRILRKRVIQMLHCAHPGITRTKTLAHSYAYWPGIDSDIESTVKSCEQCARAAKVPVKAELHSWPLPDGPWKRVHADFAGPLNDQYFLILVDAFCKWPEIVPLRTISTTTIISCLSRIFAQFGFPETLVTENGTQFTSTQFSQFCKPFATEHARSPPYHTQSNGQAERFWIHSKGLSTNWRGKKECVKFWTLFCVPTVLQQIQPYQMAFH
ncbi:uncharacterized protein DEA37_0009804 [Paragonimus westermani]|uniref:Integrase catalytic domain-containing protein n=1 Tax=Paragonimus westermani TaxID=34504 RepID=A0A5J4P5T0_9TREM|nr:uncharacterized protein DEA37_0009804 [Paragonimus westermani]